ncbi:heparinase [Exiguobacterium sp. SH0S1]|nr:heparinase [Exiguobacterium sp. SH0S1]
MAGGAILSHPEPAAASSDAVFQLRTTPNATLYEYKYARLVPTKKLGTSMRYRVTGVSGDYFVISEAKKKIYIKKNEARLFHIQPLTRAHLSSALTRQLAHDFEKSTRVYEPYEYVRLVSPYAEQLANRAVRGDWSIPTAPHQLLVKNIDTFDWHTGIPKTENDSFPFQIHYWVTLNQLTQAYNNTGNIAYLKYGERFVKSWTKAHPVSKYKEYRWPYNDHSTAIRTFHLLNYWDAYKKSTLHKDPAFTALILKTIHEHGTLLATPSFYMPQHNHGMFQDIALMAIAKQHPSFDKSVEWQTLATQRLQVQIDQGISRDGVHLEHSPGYQSYLYYTFIRLKAWADANRFPLPSNVSRIDKMPVQLTYMMKPNGTLPIFGDTTGVTQSLSIIPDIMKYPELAYAVTQGKRGKKPPLTLKKVGTQYSFMREYWSAPPRSFDNATQVMMTAGFNSKVHKHADDLNIDVYGLGRDFITETGRYGYTKRPERARVFGVEAHNTVHRAGENLDLRPDMRGKSYIASIKDTGGTSVAIGESKLMGKGANHRRTLVYDKAQTLVVYDRITSPTASKFVQRFHLAEGLKPLQSSLQNQNILYGDTSGRTIQIMQLNRRPNSSMQRSTSFVSVKDYEWKPRSQVISYHSGKDVTFVTLIRLDQKKKTITKATLQPKGNRYVVTYTLSDKTTGKIEFDK